MMWLFSFDLTAGSGVGASASLAGDVNNGGSFGVGQADAYAGGVRKEVIKTVSTSNVIANGEPTDAAPVPTIPIQSNQPVSKVVQIETQSENSNIPTSTPGSQYIPPPKKIQQSDQSSDSDQLQPVKKIEQSDQSSDSDQLEPVKKIEQSDQSSDSDRFEPENPEKSQTTTKPQTTTKSPTKSTTTLAPTTTVTSPSMVYSQDICSIFYAYNQRNQMISFPRS